MKLTDLTCKKCGASLSENDFLENMPVIRCPHCGTVFQVDGPGRGNGKNIGERKEGPIVPLPAKFTAEFKGGNFVISYKWFTPVSIFLIFFTVIWNAFMLVWHGIALGKGLWFMSLAGGIHTCVGIGLLYYTAATLFNTTTITVGTGYVAVKHYPIPWMGNVRFHAMDIEQVYCKQKRGQKGAITYQVFVVKRKNKKSVKLLSSLQDYEQARFIEQELETKLGIVDREVAGEMSPS